MSEYDLYQKLTLCGKVKAGILVKIMNMICDKRYLAAIQHANELMGILLSDAFRAGIREAVKK